MSDFGKEIENALRRGKILRERPKKQQLKLARYMGALRPSPKRIDEIAKALGKTEKQYPAIQALYKRNEENWGVFVFFPTEVDTSGLSYVVPVDWMKQNGINLPGKEQ